ncbi:Mitochondrial carrier protein [Plasmodiophora brassicae]
MAHGGDAGRPAPTMLQMMGASGVAACVAEVATIPIDTAKVRLQIQAGRSGGVYTGLFQTVARIAVDESPASLWKGVSAGLARQIVYAPLRIGLYGPTRDWIGQGDTGLATRIAAGLATGCIGISVANPVDLIKIRLQAQGRLPPGTPPRYAGMTDAVRQIARTEGVAGFWTGILPNIARNSIINAAELATYDQFKSMALETSYFKDDVVTHVVCALAAGFSATVVGSPVDVIKTRVMNSTTGADGVKLYDGALDCALKIARNEGVLAFYKGFVANYARIGSWNLVMFLTMEQIRLRVF